MPFIASMGIYVVSKDVMLDLLRDKFPGANDFGSEVIPGATSLGLRVCFPLLLIISSDILLLSCLFYVTLAAQSTMYIVLGSLERGDLITW